MVRRVAANRWHGSRLRPPMIVNRLRRMLPRLSLLAGLLIIDIGCGNDDSASVTDGRDGAVDAGGGAAGASGSGGSGGQVGSGGAPDAWRERCQAVVDHNAACGKSSADTAAVDDCMLTAACVPSAWSSDVVDTIMTCLANLACESPDDDCIAMTVSDQTPIKMALFAACEDKATACPMFDGCLETTFLVSDTLASSLAACLEQSCDAASSCLLNEYTAAITAAGCTGELPFGG